MNKFIFLMLISISFAAQEYSFYIEESGTAQIDAKIDISDLEISSQKIEQIKAYCLLEEGCEVGEKTIKTNFELEPGFEYTFNKYNNLLWTVYEVKIKKLPTSTFGQRLEKILRDNGVDATINKVAIDVEDAQINAKINVILPDKEKYEFKTGEKIEIKQEKLNTSLIIILIGITILVILGISFTKVML